MFRRYLFAPFALTILIVSTAVLAAGQAGQLRGHVVMKQADGTTVPAAGAQIDVFRTDINGKYETKTDKKGEFVFAGIPFVGTYIVAVSLAGARPDWLPNVKAGRDVDYAFTLTPGDGSRLTLDQLKAALAQAGGSGPAAAPSADQKAKQAEAARQNAEIAAANEKAKSINEVIGRTFKAGNEALLAKNYDEAIRQYEEGLAAAPEQSGMLTNEAVAYKARGVQKFNESFSAKDDAAKTSGIEAARKDFKAAAAASAKAVTLIKAMPAPTEASELARYNGNKISGFATYAESMRLVASKVDPTQADAALAAFKEYIAVEPDPAKKAKAKTDAAQMLMDAGAPDKAFAEFRTILETEPDNADANLGAGLALFSSGDKTKYQDAANYLQRFLEKAPDSHPLKQSGREALDYLKTAEKVVPEKTAPATRRRRP